jgi:hypothetical protein
MSAGRLAMGRTGVVPELVLLRRGDEEIPILLLPVLLKQLPMVEEAWLIHHLQDHKQRKMEDKDGIGQQYAMFFLHKVYQTLIVWMYVVEHDDI